MAERNNLRLKFVHCADLHLGARFKGISDTSKAESMRNAVFDSFRRIIDLTISEKADALIISGDAFDESTITPKTRMFLANELERAKVPVFMVRGNHDPHTSWESSIPFPSNVRMFGTEPESFPIPGIEGVEVIGASYADWHEERNLPSIMRGSPDKFTIAVVHCDVDGQSSEYAYSPCRLTDLQGKGVDYWALGHIHKRGILSQSPWAVYPGNIQGRNLKETGEKGAYVVTVEGGRIADARFVPTQSIVMRDEEIDITGKTLDGVMSEIGSKAGKGDVARVRFVGAGDLDAMLRSNSGIHDLISSKVGCTIAEIEVGTSPAIDIEARAESRDMIGLTIRSGRKLSSSRQEIIDAICGNVVAKKYRSEIEAMSDEELSAIADMAMRNLVNKLGVQR